MKRLLLVAISFALVGLVATVHTASAGAAGDCPPDKAFVQGSSGDTITIPAAGVYQIHGSGVAEDNPNSPLNYAVVCAVAVNSNATSVSVDFVSFLPAIWITLFIIMLQLIVLIGILHGRTKPS